MKIYLASPRGFCAGVDRAIEIVELSLKAYGAPIYVRHEIVHSRHVVNSLRDKGAVFVEELTEVPDGSIVIFSAHGVAKEVWAEANRRGLKTIDATCPLVIKVHNEVNRDYTQGYELILIGHAGHPEVIGTLGQVPDKFHLVSSVGDVENLHVENTHHLSYVTQTTLSVDECRDIVGALHKRFPNIKGPHQEDICYATQNRQNAVKALSKDFADYLYHNVAVSVPYHPALKIAGRPGDKPREFRARCEDAARAGRDEEIENKLNIMMAMLTPVLLIVMGGFVALILLALYLPLFGLAGVLH